MNDWERNIDCFCNKLDNKVFCELNKNMRELIKNLYTEVSFMDVIHCKIKRSSCKYNLVISISGVKKRLSYKSSRNNLIHSECLLKFTKYLNKNGINKALIENIIEYQYKESKGNNKLKKEFLKLNKIVNRKILKKLIIRFLIKDKFFSIDGLLCGSSNKFMYISLQQLFDILVINKLKHMHFSSLRINFILKDFNYLDNYINDLKKYKIEVNWDSIFNDYFKYLNNTKTTL